jgi:RNA repair, ligase-Pnkp-associating, region of Hen1/Vanillate O-demethylase oxygenase C-terminal domain
VNDRPYAASSFLSVALTRSLRTAMGGTSKERPDLALTAIPLEATVTPLRAQGGEKIERALFEPLGWTVDVEPIEGIGSQAGRSSRYVTLHLKGHARLSELLSAGNFLIVLHHVPVSVGRCRQHWLMSIGQATDETPHSVRWLDETAEVLEQDRRILEAAQIRYAAEGEAFEHSVEADVPTITARRILRMAAGGMWNEQRQRLKPRRTIAVRG